MGCLWGKSVSLWDYRKRTTGWLGFFFQASQHPAATSFYSSAKRCRRPPSTLPGYLLCWAWGPLPNCPRPTRPKGFSSKAYCLSTAQPDLSQLLSSGLSHGMAEALFPFHELFLDLVQENFVGVQALVIVPCDKTKCPQKSNWKIQQRNSSTVG